MPFSSTICDFYNKKNNILNQLVGGCVTRDATRPPASSETDLIRKLMFFISLLNDITAETRSAFSSLQKYFVEALFIFFSTFSFILFLRRQS